jgi:exopolysaccharide biosynthesis polyprenyl glycosylphosphotransferase
MYVKKNGWIKHLDFILADLLCINLTFLLAYFLRCGFHNMYALSGYRMIILVAMILHFCISFFSNYYSGILKRGYIKEIKMVILHNIVLIGALFAYMFVLQIGDNYSRIVLVAFFFMNIITMYIVHITLKYILRKRVVQIAKQQRLLVVTTAKLAQETIERLMDGPDKSYYIVGITLDEKDENIQQVKGIPVVAYGKDVYDYACRHVIDSVVICLNSSAMEKADEMAEKFLNMGITVHIKVNMLLKGLEQVYMGHINGANVITASTKTVAPTEMYFKRLIDICAGIAGCLITGVLFIFIAPAIKIADPKGTVFFAQERAGKNGRPFKIYKFRSMYADAEERKKELMNQNKMDGLMFKLDADPRIIGSGPDGTKKGLGHFLRSTSLDEFPNFWSILKGDMSLVGTRPPTMDEYEKYEYHHKSRLATKPGLTGLWQVSGRSNFTDFEEIVKLDNEYIKSWSVGLDIKIILKTIVVVFTRNGSV